MNIFSVLDESDDEEQTKVVAQKPKDGAKPAAGAKKDTPAGAKPAAKAPEAKKDAAPAKDAKAKVTGDKPKAAAPKTAAPAADAEDATSGKDNNRGGHARGRDNKGGRGRGHGAPESAEGQTRVKREFDRRSGTGRGREVSKGGRGAFGFGNPAQDAQDAEKNPEGADAILTPVDGADESAEPAEPVEPEPVVYGLDEFLAKRDEARRAFLANETKLRVVDKSALAGLTKKEEESNVLYMADKVKAAKAEAARKDQRSTGKQQVLDVAFKFESVQVDDGEERRGGGRGRGGRGGARESGRGSSGRGNSGRGSRPATGGNNAKPTTVFNSLDFPSL